jgi:hypothetical protein
VRVAGLLFGSSRLSGEGGLDLQEEIGWVAESVGHALDDLDAVIDAFQDAGVEREDCGGQDAAQVFAQSFGEGNRRRDAAVDRQL